MGLQLSHNYKLEILRAELVRKMPPERLQWLFPMPPDGTPVTTQPTTRSVARPRPTTSWRVCWDLIMPHRTNGSWAGRARQSGKPILANDPHLGLEAPILWYLVRIVTPEGTLKGATVPGLPIVLLGQNNHMAWGFTTTGSDVQDLFMETLIREMPMNIWRPRQRTICAAH